MQVTRSKRFKKDFANAQRKHDDLNELLTEFLCNLISGKRLERKWCDHPLQGEYANHRDCHLKPDLIVIYQKTKTHIYLYRLGTHSELFG